MLESIVIVLSQFILCCLLCWQAYRAEKYSVMLMKNQDALIDLMQSTNDFYEKSLATCKENILLKNKIKKICEASANEQN